MKALRRAVTLAQADHPDDWQAECCEIVLIPAIARRWQELNPSRPGLRVIRVDGFAGRSRSRDDNERISRNHQWSLYAGYRLVVMSFSDGQEYPWNSVRDDYYSHSPSTTWNGMSRETICRFIEQLRMAVCGYEPDADVLRRAGIQIVASELQVPHVPS